MRTKRRAREEDQRTYVHIGSLNQSSKVALVTGASQGIGRAVALRLAQDGFSVALAARNEEKLEQVAAEIAAAGGRAEVFALDVANEESIKATAKAVLAHYGKLDVLVNNAGITRDNLLLRMKRADWDDVLQTNLTGAFLLTQAVHGLDDQGPLGPDHQHLQRRRAHRSGRPGELRRQQGRTHRLHQIARPRTRLARSHRQRRRPRLYREPDDRGAR